MPVMPMAAIAVTSPLPGCTGLLSISRFHVGVTVQGALQDPGRGTDLRLRRLQDRILAWSGPGRERLAEVAVIGVFGGDRQALPFGEPVGERPAPGGQVLDPLALLGNVLSRGQGELRALGVRGGLRVRPNEAG